MFQSPLDLFYDSLDVVCLDPTSNKLYYTNGTERTWDSPAAKSLPTKTSHKVFVGNVPSDVTSEEFAEFFKPYGSKWAVLTKKPDSTGSSFGFVSFATEAERDAFLKTPVILHGRKLLVNIAKRNAKAHAEVEKKKIAPDGNSRTLFINGLAATTTFKDVQNAFLIYAPHSVRVPMDSNGVCKGYAFVEVASEEQRNSILAHLKQITICGVSCKVRECLPPKKYEDNHILKLLKTPPQMNNIIKTSPNNLQLDQTPSSSKVVLPNQLMYTSQNSASHSSISPPRKLTPLPNNTPSLLQNPTDLNPSPLTPESPLRIPPPPSFTGTFSPSKNSPPPFTPTPSPSPSTYINEDVFSEEQLTSYSSENLATPQYSLPPPPPTANPSFSLTPFTTVLPPPHPLLNAFKLSSSVSTGDSDYTTNIQPPPTS